METTRAGAPGTADLTEILHADSCCNLRTASLGPRPTPVGDCTWCGQECSGSDRGQLGPDPVVLRGGGQSVRGMIWGIV
jgi:hypothetical protein